MPAVDKACMETTRKDCIAISSGFGRKTLDEGTKEGFDVAPQNGTVKNSNDNPTNDPFKP